MCYHLVSRVAHKAFFFDAEEKCRFVDLLKRTVAFSGVRLLGWCVMSNHFHIFIYLPSEEPLTDDQLLDRVKALYRGTQLVQVLAQWDEFKKEADEEAASGVTCGSRFEEFKNRLRVRMFHTGEFMRTLKQYLTNSFNGRRVHCGTLWETRYKVRVSKPNVKDMSEQLAYVDCNPFEAGNCANPADYEWSGWHAAVAGDEFAREMYRFVYSGKNAQFEESTSDMTWEDIVEVHEKAIRKRIGDISDAKTAGEESDWMFSARADHGMNGADSEKDQGEMLSAGDEMRPPEKRAIQLERGNGKTAERILSAVKAAGELSAGEILESIEISSRPFLLTAYIKPMVAQGFLAPSFPDKPSSRHQKYRLGNNVSETCV